MECMQRDGQKIYFRENTVDAEVIRKCYQGRLFFIDEYHPRPEHVVIDVSAHIGAFALRIAQVVTRGRVFAIEASLDSYEILKLNIQANGLVNVHPCHLALAGQAGSAKLFHDVETGNWGHCLTKELSESFEVVPADTLAGFMQKNGISRCDFLKMNAEGSEFPILLAAPESVLRRIDLMLICYHLDLAPEHRLRELVTHLLHSQFNVAIREKNEHRGWVIARRREKVSARMRAAALARLYCHENRDSLQVRFIKQVRRMLAGSRQPPGPGR